MADSFTDDDIRAMERDGQIEQQQSPITDADIDEWGGHTVKPQGAIGSALRGAALEVIPGIAAAGAGIPAAIATQATVPIPGSGIVGGLAAGAVAGAGARKLEDMILDAIGVKGGHGMFSDAQEIANKQEHPYASFGGELAGGIAPGFGLGRGAMKLARGVGAGIQGGLEAGTEYVRGEDFDPARVGMAAGAGALWAKPRPWVNKVARPVDEYFNPENYKRFTLQGDPYGPEPGPKPIRPNRGITQNSPLEGEILPPERTRIGTDYEAPDKNIDHNPYEFDDPEHMSEFARQQVDRYADEPDMQQYWKDYLAHLQQSRGKANPEDVQQASQGLGEKFTPAHADRGNDLTTVARGVATENPPAPQIDAAGNPTGAPMQARRGARPSDALRDYRKNKPAELPSPEGSNRMTQGQFTPDVHAALVRDKPTSTFAQQTVQPGQGEILPPAQGYVNPEAVTGNKAKDLDAGLTARTRQFVKPGGNMDMALRDEFKGLTEHGEQPAPETIEGEVQRPQRQLPRPAPASDGGMPEPSQRPKANVGKLVQRAMQIAMRRPIEVRDVPETGNSSKDLSGPVYVHPRVPPEARRFIAVHETVEQMLMAEGHEYPYAHAMATQAEKAAVERAGRKWEQYQHKVDHVVAEDAKETSPGAQPTDKHVSTEEALGKPSPSEPLRPLGAEVSPEPGTVPEAELAGMLEKHFGPEAAAAPKKRVTATVTPKPQSLETRLQERGMTRVLKALHEQPKLRGKIESMLNDADAEKAGKEKYQQHKARGMAYRGERGERIKNANKSVQDGVDESMLVFNSDAPFDEHDLTAMAKYVQDKVTRANGGADPLGGEKGFSPKVWKENPHYAVAKTAWDVVRHPDDDNLNAFWAALKAYDARNLDAIEDLQASRKGAANTNLNRRTELPLNEEVRHEEPIHEERRAFEARNDFESDIENSRHRDLVNWLNKLDDVQYRKLVDMDPSIFESVATTNDPRATRLEYMDLLQALERKRPKVEAPVGPKVHYPEAAGFDRVAAEDVERGVETKITKAADLPENKGRHIDPNSEEGRKIAERALAQYANKIGVKQDKMTDAQIGEAKLKAAIDADDPSLFKEGLRLFTDESGGGPLPERLQKIFDMRQGGATWKAIADELGLSRARVAQLFERAERLNAEPPKGERRARLAELFKKFAKDEGGAASFDKMWDNWRNRGKNRTASSSPDFTSTSGYEGIAAAMGRLKDRMHSWWDPIHPSAMDDYAKGLGEDFVKLRGNMTQFKMDLHKATDASQALGWSKEKWGKLYRAGELGNVKSLPLDMQNAWGEHVQPLLDKYGVLYDELRGLMEKHKLPGWDKLPERVEGITKWMPRAIKGRQIWEDLSEYDALAPKRGQTLSPFAETTKPREWFSAQADSGERITYYINDDGKAIIMSGGNARGQIVADNRTQVGEKFRTRRKEWTVDNARIDEIHAATKGVDPATGKPLEYYDDPMLSIVEAIEGLHNANQRVKMLDKIVSSDMFKNNTTTNRANPLINANPANIWETTKLPGFEGVYMPKQLRWVLDDYYKPGLGLYTPKADTVATSGTKLFYFLGPMVHVLNEADKWFIGRGFDWVNPAAYGRLVKTMTQAVRSVNAQNHIQKEMVENGANPMYAHTFVQRFMPDIYEKLGYDIARNPAAWDPVFKAFGVTAKEGWDKAYKLSTKVMWKASDYMLTQRYLELKAKGLSPKDAVKGAHDFIDSYVMPTHFGRNGTELGRFTKQLLSDPKVSLFGPYHYGVFHTWAHMTSGLVGKNATMAERTEALGHFMAAGAMLAVVYPALSALYSAVTGDPHSELEQRGASRLAGTLGKVYSGEKGIDAAARNIWTPSVPVDTAYQIGKNKDFAGKDIVMRGGTPAEQVGQLGQFMINQWFSPIKAPITEAAKGEAGHPVRKFIESQVGLRTPSDAEVKQRGLAEKHTNMDRKTRTKKPGGLFDYYWYRN